MAGDDEYEIPDTGAVFTFGRSRFAENVSSHFFIRNDPVVEISCGDEHTALVCKSGRVFLFGHNDYGQLGFGHTKVVNKPSCLKYLKPFHSTHIACGKSHTIISTSCARIFTFGCNSDGQLGVGDLNDRLVPQMVPTTLSEEDNICAVAAGSHHSAFLTEKGEVYLWGSNSDGQCGADEEPFFPTPQKLEFNQPISSVSCGYYHTAFTSLGSVYTFGEEDNGKLGRPRNSPKGTPAKVESLDDCKLVKCGGSHTLVLTDGGDVYAFGSNFSGQLGIGNFESECPAPIQIEFPDKNIKIVNMSSGESHSGFVTDQGNLYTCGDSRHGKLCNDDDSTNYTTPTLIPMFENYFCTNVDCGGCHTMVLAKARLPELGKDISFPQINKDVLPPLKTSVNISELRNETNDTNTITEEKTEEIKEDTEIIEDSDNKSNPESNLNNEEVSSHLDEIYTEIKEIVPENDEEEVQTPESDPNRVQQTNDSNENNLVVVRTESAVKKLFNVFKKKKSTGEILSAEDSEENGKEKIQTENEFKTGNQQKSRTCAIL